MQPVRDIDRMYGWAVGTAGDGQNMTVMTAVYWEVPSDTALIQKALGCSQDISLL